MEYETEFRGLGAKGTDYSGNSEFDRENQIILANILMAQSAFSFLYVFNFEKNYFQKLERTSKHFENVKN
jgi:hypothetical protein